MSKIWNVKYLLLALLAWCGTVQGAPFAWSTRQLAPDQLQVAVQVAPQHYLYISELKLEVKDARGQLLKPQRAPQAVKYVDPVLESEVEILPAGQSQWNFKGTAPFQVKVSFQGCRKAEGKNPAMCLLPETLELSATPQPVATPQVQLDDDLAQLRAIRKVEGLLNREQFRQFLQGAESGEKVATEPGFFDGFGIWMILLLTILGGLGLNLTPCVLPMIPVNLAIIGARESKQAGFRRGLLYGLGMALTYGILGLAVILTGAKFGELNANSWFNFAVAALFVVLAAAMFGAFNLDFSSKINVNPQNLKVGKSLVALIMGAVAALLAGACVAPVVIGVLLFAAERYNAGYPVALLLPFLLGIGMGLPWPFAGAGLAVLPKPGKFMMTVKYIFGVLILAMAGYYLYIGVTLLPGKYSVQDELTKLKATVVRAQANHKLVVIDFWASWCKNCKEMERSVLKDPEVLKALEKFEFCKFQAEKPGDPAVSGLLNQWKINGLPAFVIVKPPQK